MKRLLLAGAGNLAWSLAYDLSLLSPYTLTLISSTSLSARVLAAHTGCAWTDPDGLKREAPFDGVLLAVGDRDIPAAAQAYARHLHPDGWMVHTSGATPMAALAPFVSNPGVLYPLQTFTKGRYSPVRGSGLFWEGDANTVGILAKELHPGAVALDSSDRFRLHLAAVWASNFPNLLWKISKDLMPASLSWEVLRPLVETQVQKAFTLGPAGAQTGPALRQDHDTMNLHLKGITDESRNELYRRLSFQIFLEFLHLNSEA